MANIGDFNGRRRAPWRSVRPWSSALGRPAGPDRPHGRQRARPPDLCRSGGGRRGLATGNWRRAGYLSVQARRSEPVGHDQRRPLRRRRRRNLEPRLSAAQAAKRSANRQPAVLPLSGGAKSGQAARPRTPLMDDAGQQKGRPLRGGPLTYLLIKAIKNSTDRRTPAIPSRIPAMSILTVYWTLFEGSMSLLLKSHDRPRHECCGYTSRSSEWCVVGAHAGPFILRF